MRTHGLHGMHGLRAHPLALAVLLAALTSTARAAEPSTIPTAAPGIAAPLCTVGQPCIFGASIFACSYDNAERIAQAGPVQGNAIGLGLVREKACELVSAGRPVGTEATKSARVVYLTEGGKHLGYMPIGVFAAVEAAPPEPEPDVPLSVSTRLGDFAVSAGRAPLARAVALTGQMTGTAAGLFRAGPAERRAFCVLSGDREGAALRSCLDDYPDHERQVRADCPHRVVTVDDRILRLYPRPVSLPAETHLDEKRRWLWRDVATDEWLDGSVVSGEDTINSAFDALCPGRRPDADSGLVYRDPQAAYPRELWGRWFDDAGACADPARNAPGYDEHGVLTIAARERGGNRAFEFPQRVNAVRRLGPQTWQVDGSHRIDAADVPEIFATATYTLTRDGLDLSREGSTTHWVRCR